MKRKLFSGAVAAVSVVILLSVTATIMSAQTMTTGDIAGVVTDSSGAVVPNAAVSLKSAATGELRTAQTNSAGAYRISLLKPGTYAVSAVAPGLKSDIMSNVAVAVGQVQTVDLVLKPQEAKEVITVTEAVPLLQTENANLSAAFSSKQIDMLPTPGGDITTAAFTIPGVAVSTGAGYGNFSAHGLPGTSNLFTLNGNDNTDSYLNLNNSGASNLTLGGTEVDQVSIVQNAYSAQYGRNAGAQVNFITKSGANQFHADMLYNYNGSTLNANDFFANATDTPRGRAISNQYGASLGGPIKRDKLFFFVNTEGMRYVLPTTGAVSLPSKALQDYILGNVTAAQVPFYQQAFNLYNKAPGANRAVPVTNGNGPLQDSYEALGCGTLQGTSIGGGQVLGENVSCANAFTTNVSNMNKEWIFGSRVDYNLSDNHKLFFRYKTDHGLQPTYTDPINPVFNAESSQPQHEGQVNYTWVVNPSLVNNFIGSALYYSAIFAPSDLKASQQAFPSYLVFFDGGTNGSNSQAGGLTDLGLPYSNYPQGRRVGQLQIVDDLSWTKGRHSLKFGLNYRYNRLTDTGNQRLVYGGRYQFYGLNEFADGVIDPTSGTNYQQRFTPFPVVHIRAYNAGFYAQDEWAVSPALKLTLGLRFDRTGNPTCVDKCFALMNDPFATLQKGLSIPYNQSISPYNNSAYYSIEPVALQPRFGIVYNPSWSKHTVIRGGVGLFTDLPPLTLIQGLYGSNAPNVFTPSIRTSALVNSGGAGSAPAVAAATGAAFASGFTNGLTLAQITSALAPVSFTEPAYRVMPGDFNSPKYLEWSFEVQQELSAKNVLTLSYVGNHGYDLILQNLKVNGWVNTASTYTKGFGGLPTAAPDPRFRIVTDITNNGFSNYDGLSVTFRRGLGFGFQGELTYTWSHSLDTISNGGVLVYDANTSFTSAFYPYDARYLNYGSSDYDIRHNFTADFSWEIPVKMQNKALNSVLSGWTLGSKWFVRTGTPFSVYNSRIPGRISVAVGGSVLADVLDANVQKSCTNVDTPCFSTSQFAVYNKQTDWGNWPRNSFRGPGYFDVDSTLFKSIRLGERYRFTLGASAYNILNHPNFAAPGGDAASSGFGVISSTVGAPASPYGSFQGSAVSGRVMVLSGKFSF